MCRSSYFPISHIILLTRHYETSAMRGRKHLCYNIFILHTTHCHNIVGLKVWVEPFGKVEEGTMREGQLERRVKREHHAADSWSSEESVAAALWEQSTADHALHCPRTRDKRQGMRSIPQGPRRIISQSSGLRGASSLQDTKRQGAS